MAQKHKCMGIGCGKKATKLLKFEIVSSQLPEGAIEEHGAIVDTEIFSCDRDATEASAQSFLDENDRIRRLLTEQFEAQGLATPDWDKSQAYWENIPVRFELPQKKVIASVSSISRKKKFPH